LRSVSSAISAGYARIPCRARTGKLCKANRELTRRNRETSGNFLCAGRGRRDGGVPGVNAEPPALTNGGGQVEAAAASPPRPSNRTIT
jgi:hypothetical protein